VIGAIPAKLFGLQLLDPGSDNGSQGFHGKLVQAASQERHQPSDIADVERVGFFAGIFILLLIVTRVLGDMLLLGAPAGYGSTPLTLFTSRRGLMWWLDNRRRVFWHVRCMAPQVLEARDRLVAALCAAIGGCDRPDALGNRRWKLWFLLIYSDLWFLLFYSDL
jgi:hypothetical protein